MIWVQSISTRENISWVFCILPISTYLFHLMDLFGKLILYVYFLEPNNIMAKTLENLIDHEDSSRTEYKKRKINRMIKSRQ